MVLFRAHFIRDKLVCWCAWFRLASGNEIWSRPSHGILDNVRDKECQDHAYEPAEDRDVRFMCAGADEHGP